MRLFCMILLLGIFCFLGSKVGAQEEIFTAVAWSPDGETLAIGGGNASDGIILLYNILQQSFTRTVISGEVTRLAWSPDGSRLAVRFNSGGAGSKIAIWDAVFSETLIVTEEVSNSGFYSLLKWSPDGHFVAVDTGAAIEIFNSSIGTKEAILYDTRFGNTGPIEFGWSLDSQSIYVLYDIRVKEEVVIWNIQTTKVVQAFDVAKNAVNFALSPDETHFAVNEMFYDASGVTELWVYIADTKTGKVLERLWVGKQTVLQKMFWSSDGTRFIGIDSQGIVYVWDTTTNQLIDKLYTIVDEAADFRDASLSPNNGQLAVANIPGYQQPASQAIPEIYRQRLLNNNVQIIVPAPSLALLDSIQTACVPTKPPTALPTTDNLTIYIDAVKADASIPPACVADLIAVAEALLDSER